MTDNLIRFWFTVTIASIYDANDKRGTGLICWLIALILLTIEIISLKP